MPRSLTLNEVDAALLTNRPGFDDWEKRLHLMRSLDQIVDFSVRDLDRDEQKLKSLVQFYKKRVETGLNELERKSVTNGVQVFKFYSSSIVLKSSEGTVAIDFCQGPVGNDYKNGDFANEGEPEKSDFFKTKFFLSVKQRDKLASLVDVYIITHSHQDHADYSLARRMIAQNKTVIGTEQLKLKWEDLADKITVPNFETTQKFGPCEIFSQFGMQYKKIIEKDGEKVTVPSKYLSMDVESIRYLIRMGGITFLQSAENHQEAYQWLQKAQSKGWNLNVLISAGKFQGERSVMKYLTDHDIDYFNLPVHEYELTHGKGGFRLAQNMEGRFKDMYDRKRNMPLIWGEDFFIPEALF